MKIGIRLGGAPGTQEDDGRSTLSKDPYFEPGLSWSDRRSAICSGLSRFEAANVEVVARCVRDDHLRVVINMPAEALLAVLGGDHYRNCYELPFVAGERRGPSPKRITVDGLLGFVPDGRDVYFGAVSFGGTGVRFYGEYCVVLDSAAIGDPALLDRNSYELLEPPLADHLTRHATPTVIVDTLRARWDEVSNVLVLKVLSTVSQAQRLLPPGVVAEHVLRDEDFVEVHLRVRIDARAIEEVRQAPEEVARDARIRQQLGRGLLPAPEELLWTSRRAEVDRAMAGAGVRSRIVTTTGRGTRWR